MDENKYETISVYNEDGTVKSKEDFIKDVEKFYDNTVEPLAEKKHIGESNSILDLLTDPDAQIDTSLVLETFNFATRTIFITDEIDSVIGHEIVRQIRFWNHVDTIDNISKEERTPIKIYIDTPGGEIQPVFNIISAIKMSETPVYTITYGCGYSGGFFIGISGHKRFGFSNSSYLFHEGMTIDGGDAHKFLQHANFYKFQLSRMKDIVISNTKINSEEYDEHKKDDWFFSPTEAIHYGVIDKVLNSFNEEEMENG